MKISDIYFQIYGTISNGPLQGVPISGCLGDQQAALLGQMCLQKGQAKATYGTGCFVLYNTGDIIVQSSKGLLTTVAFQMGPDSPALYALEGSVSINLFVYVICCNEHSSIATKSQKAQLISTLK